MQTDTQFVLVFVQIIKSTSGTIHYILSRITTLHDMFPVYSIPIIWEQGGFGVCLFFWQHLSFKSESDKSEQSFSKVIS